MKISSASRRCSRPPLDPDDARPATWAAASEYPTKNICPSSSSSLYIWNLWLPGQPNISGNDRLEPWFLDFIGNWKMRVWNCCSFLLPEISSAWSTPKCGSLYRIAGYILVARKTRSLKKRPQFRLKAMHVEKNKMTLTWWFKVTFLWWLSDPFKRLSDLQLGMKRALWITWN